MTRRARVGIAAAVLGGVAMAFGATQLPAMGAGGLLHPARHRLVAARPAACDDAMFQGEGVELSGWRCRAIGTLRGTIVYLHGVADNRGSSTGAIERFTTRGFDVVAYDSRAHGESAGEACTYGFYEKQDLHRVLDAVAPGPIVLIGTSLGAAVALQEAATDPRVSGVIAAETFADLRTVAAERAPFFFTRGIIQRAFRLAEAQAHFRVDDVSPAQAASRITAPVLLVHGAADVETPPDHSQRVLAALAGPKRLILVPGAGHNGSLRGDVWGEMERWVDEVVPACGLGPVFTTEPGVHEPRLIGETKPEFPDTNGHRVEAGAMIFQAVIDRTGSVCDLALLRSGAKFTPPLPAYERAWRDAIAKSTYVPATLNGEPVKFRMTVTVLVHVK